MSVLVWIKTDIESSASMWCRHNVQHLSLAVNMEDSYVQNHFYSSSFPEISCLVSFSLSPFFYFFILFFLLSILYHWSCV